MKTITDNQITGELGEVAVTKLVLEMGMIFERRGRLEAGIDGLIELRDPVNQAPLGKLLGVQIKSTRTQKYSGESESHFDYLLHPDDLSYWRHSNIPVIIVVWRQSDDSAYWKDVTDIYRGNNRKLRFDKKVDVLNSASVDRLAALTIDRSTPGVFLPPLNQGEEVLLNLLRIQMPDELFIATSPFGSGRDAISHLLKQSAPRYDWVIRKRRFISFANPELYDTMAIVDEDQVEAIDTDLFVMNDDVDDTNDTIDLLRRTLERQLSGQLRYARKDRVFYFRAFEQFKPRKFSYPSKLSQTSAKVVGIYEDKKCRDKVGFVRHHAASFRFERLGDEWFIVIDPTFYFTTDGFQPHRHPEALLSGKKRLERNAAIRGQVIMWQHLLVSSSDRSQPTLFEDPEEEHPRLQFLDLPGLQLQCAVPESSWVHTDPRVTQMDSAKLFEEGLF